MTARQAALLLVWLTALLGLQVGAAGPAAAHAELVATTPADGTRLEEAPTEVVLEFTEPVGLVTGGLRLLDADGKAVTAPEPDTDGSRVRWAMPDDLPDGGYVVSWRVLSGDGHPVTGAFSFGVGSAAPAVLPDATSADAPWPVVAARLGGYLGYSLVAGVVAVVVLCWPAGRGHVVPRRLFRAGLVLAGSSAVAAFLLQGPYVAGLPLSRPFDRALVQATGQSSFGAWTELRVYLLVALAALAWPAGALGSTLLRRLAVGGVVATAVTFPGTGHAATGGVLDRGVDAAHVLLAGTWLGGLVVLALAATAGRDRPDLPVLLRFSRLALVTVVGLVLTGVLNSLTRIGSLAALWDSEYGRLLLAKLVLVLAALAAAATSRARLRRGDTPRGTVRVEAAVTLAVLAVTAVLASTAPTTAATTATDRSATASTTVELDLGEGRTALVTVDPPGTTGSSVSVEVADAADVRLRATLEEQGIGPLDIPLERTDEGWSGTTTFPYAGEWTLLLTVEDERLTAVVTSGRLQVR